MTTRQISYRLKADGKAELQRDAKQVGDALQDAGDRGAAAFERTGRVLQNTGELSDRQIEKYKKLAAAAREAAAAEEAQGRFNSALGVGRGSRWSAADFMTQEEAAGRAGLTRGQRAGRLNLARQGADIFTTAAMGMSPGMIAIQQGPQIIDALAQAGIKATPAMLALSGVVVGLGGAIIAAGVAQDAYAKSVLQLDVAARGLGATAGMTAEQINAQAMAAADAGEISNKTARQFAATYVATGKIGQTVLGDLVALTQDFAATTRQDAAAATKELATAFSDPAKGAADLNEKLNFLSVAEEEHIRNLAASGRGAEAQALLVDKLRGSLIDAADATTGWGHAFEGLGRSASNAFDTVGRYIDRLVTGGSSAERLTSARQGLAQAKMMLSIDPTNTVARNSKAQFEKEIEDNYRDYVAEMDRLRDAALNQRGRDRQAIVDRYADPKRKARQDRQNDLDSYVANGGRRDDETGKAIQADIDALKKGYASAADMATKLERAHDKAVRAGQKADRQRAAEANKAARDAEEAIRLEGLRADHANDNALRIARASGDQGAIDNLERQQRLQEDINRWVREGLSLEQARVNARAQMANEMQAESDALRRAFSNPDGFVSSQDRMAKVLAGSDFKPFRALDAYADELRISTGDAFRDGLMAGMTGGNFFDVFASRLKYAAASALADNLTSALFGSRDQGGPGSKVGWVQTALKFLPKFAGGTNFAPGGLSIVGEYGPEVVELPRGAKVHTAGSTQAMVQGLAQRAASVSAGEVVNFHYSPTYHLQGTADEIRALRAEMDLDRRNFKANAVAAYADAKARRQIN